MDFYNYFEKDLKLKQGMNKKDKKQINPKEIYLFHFMFGNE